MTPEQELAHDTARVARLIVSMQALPGTPRGRAAFARREAEGLDGWAKGCTDASSQQIVRAYASLMRAIAAGYEDPLIASVMADQED